MNQAQLHEGIWYVNTTCPMCGETEQAVPFSEAHTERAACLVAQESHRLCFEEFGRQEDAAARVAEIKAADLLLEQQCDNFDRAQARVKELMSLLTTLTEGTPEAKRMAAELESAREMVDRYTKGIVSARTRAQQTREANAS